ncbi:MAG TPA: BBE domain-containing protein [Actinopolymorphaceae bacterium]|nr:BBE domain-containing protein [Actinopolymorphaceae bacterium]
MENAYRGRENFDRLRQIKAKYDPHKLFQYEQSIPPCAPTDHRRDHHKRG